MSNVKINERILQGIIEKSEGDDAIENFLLELIYLEAEHPGNWWWKEIYKKQIDKYCEEWEVDDAN